MRHALSRQKINTYGVDEPAGHQEPAEMGWGCRQWVALAGIRTVMRVHELRSAEAHKTLTQV